MATTEQFSLRWNNFHSNLTTGFHELLEAADMVDVTLAVEGQFLQAHKIVLSICSPYFKQIFKISPSKHPIVILKDVTHDNMKDILEFMYLGEVNVLRENLPSFLRTAELLQVKGLTGDDSQSETSSRKEDKHDNLGEAEDDLEYNQILEEAGALSPNFPAPNLSPLTPKLSPSVKRQGKSPPNNTNTQKKIKADNILAKTNYSSKIKPNENKPIDEMESPLDIKLEMSACDREELPNDIKISDGSFNNISLGIDSSNTHENGRCEEKVSKNVYKCEKCFKMFSRRDHLRTHEKNIHGEDVGPFACIMCSQLYKNAESLRKHIAKFHFQRTYSQSSSKIQVSG